MLKARFSVFQGTPRTSCFWTGFSATGEYDSKLGYGYVLLGPDGEPAAKIWSHSDDFLLHSASYATTAKALTLFLDTAVECGLLCHPGKSTPPSQVVKYRFETGVRICLARPRRRAGCQDLGPFRRRPLAFGFLYDNCQGANVVCRRCCRMWTAVPPWQVDTAESSRQVLWLHAGFTRYSNYAYSPGKTGTCDRHGRLPSSW
jgi:hypothetical protein